MQKNPISETESRIFSLAEANAMLPLLRLIVSDLCHEFQSVTSRRADVHRLLRSRNAGKVSAYGDEVAEIRAELQSEYEHVWEYRREIEALGVLVRNTETGLVEVPGERFGRSGYWSWQPSESSFEHWRYAEQSLSDRQPINAELQ